MNAILNSPCIFVSCSFLLFFRSVASLLICSTLWCVLCFLSFFSSSFPSLFLSFSWDFVLLINQLFIEIIALRPLLFSFLFRLDHYHFLPASLKLLFSFLLFFKNLSYLLLTLFVLTVSTRTYRLTVPLGQVWYCSSSSSSCQQNKLYRFKLCF